MKQLKERILRDGKVFPGNVLKVGNFLNHMVDPALTLEMAREIVARFDGCQIDKVLTVEASGIPLAFAVACELGVPMLFAKKAQTKNVSQNVYTARVASFTHGRDYDLVVEKEYLSAHERILVVDDFLALGNALNGLFKICSSADVEVVGAAIAIEKGFQGGGDALRARGFRIESLAIIDSMSDGTVRFRN
ncbi:MAG: xanthine phosphoribosyltransferase [Eubacteriales bacterium]|jgi:xanthine phosphoribosyltransferase|nr:xanthine phosphoribosyltransferase [Clostridiales bacterium]